MGIVEKGILIFQDLFTNRDRVDSTNWDLIRSKYNDMINESNFLHNQLYEYMQEDNYKMINYYEKQIEKINNQIDKYEKTYPWVKKDLDRIFVGR